MEHRPLGGFEVSVVGLGCNNFGMRCDETATAQVVNAALDAGINFIDTADIYGAGLSEQYLGKALGSRRDEVVLATKFGAPMSDEPDLRGGNPKWIERAINASLRRLGTDRVDLYQMHFPDDNFPIEETLQALNKLVQDGKVREIGCSNYSASLIEEAARTSSSKGWARFISAQNHYNLLHREPEPDVIEACKTHGLSLIPYFPLASGFLTGKYRRDETPKGARLSEATSRSAATLLSEPNYQIVEKLEAYAKERGRTMLELAMSWLACRPTVCSVIAGATRPEQVNANAAATGWKLSSEEMKEIDALTG